MWKLALFVSLALAVSADWSVEQKGFWPPLSVNPTECDYRTQVCGPVSAVDFIDFQDKKFAFVATGSGIQVLDITDPEYVEEVDSANLCLGGRAIRVSPGDNVVNVWSVGYDEYCDCQDGACHVFQVELNGKLYDAREGDLSTVRFSETPIVGDVVASDPVDGCDPFTNADEVAGNVVLIKRGGCKFQQKVENAIDAGAIAVLVGNIFYNDPFNSLLTMSGDALPIPTAMIDKLAYEEVVAELATGPVVANLSTLIGKDVTDDRFVPFQGVTLMTFDGLGLSEPTFYTDLYDETEYKVYGLSELIDNEWLLVQASLKSDPSNDYLKLLFDISGNTVTIKTNLTKKEGSLNLLANYEDNMIIEAGFEVPDGEGGSDFWVYAIDSSEEYIGVWVMNDASQFDGENATITYQTGYAHPNWEVTAFNGVDTVWSADSNFGGGIGVVDATYFPDWYESRIFWPPNCIYEETSNDNVQLSTDGTVLIVGSTAEGISFWNVSETPYAPELLATFDTMPNRENDWTVFQIIYPYSDVEHLVFTSHDGTLYLELTEEDTTCPVCEVCEVCEVCDDEPKNEIGTQINLSFANLMNKK